MIDDLAAMNPDRDGASSCEVPSLQHRLDPWAVTIRITGSTKRVLRRPASIHDTTRRRPRNFPFLSTTTTSSSLPPKQLCRSTENSPRHDAIDSPRQSPRRPRTPSPRTSPPKPDNLDTVAHHPLTRIITRDNEVDTTTTAEDGEAYTIIFASAGENQSPVTELRTSTKPPSPYLPSSDVPLQCPRQMRPR